MWEYEACFGKFLRFDPLRLNARVISAVHQNNLIAVYVTRFWKISFNVTFDTSNISDHNEE